jgi:hypothetical protein
MAGFLGLDELFNGRQFDQETRLPCAVTRLLNCSKRKAVRADNIGW